MKKILSLVLCLCMLLTALPLAVHVCRDLKQKQAEQEAAGKSEVM